MDQQQIHFEVFGRRAGGSGFSLEQALEDRERAVEAAEQMLESGKFVAVKVTKETLDPDTREFKCITILNKGAPDQPKSKAPVEDRGPPCVTPADLYHVHSRDRIGRLLEGWLVRHKATPFELLHRADLIEKLDASGVEQQHAIQKISVPEAQARGLGVHEVIRSFQDLVQRAIDRVLADRRKGLFPDLAKEGFAPACARLADEPERIYLLGAGVAGRIAEAKTWTEKVGLILDLADAAPAEGPARALAFQVLEQPLGEILGSRVGMADLLGADLDLGGNLAGLTRLAAADVVAGLAQADASIARLIPPLSGQAARLGAWLQGPGFENVRIALTRRVIGELRAMRRLRPADPRGEIDILRALAMALTAAGGRLLPHEEVREAFIERSKTLVAADFVEAYLREERPVIQEARDLVWLLENVTGGANKRQAGRWLTSSITSLKFESDLLHGADTPAMRIARLAELHRLMLRATDDAAGIAPALQRVGDLAGAIEAEAKITSLLARAQAPLAQKLSALLKMATGETAPPGPAADRAKAEALKLMRSPEARAELARAPEALGQVRAMMQSLEKAA
jgi:hypothetical protein